MQKACTLLVTLVCLAFALGQFSIYLDGSIKRSMKGPIIEGGPVKRKHSWHDKLTGKLSKMGLLSPEAHKAAFAEWNAKKTSSVPTYFYCPWGNSLGPSLFPEYNHLAVSEEAFPSAIVEATPQDILQFGWHAKLKCKRWKKFPGRLIMINYETTAWDPISMDPWEYKGLKVRPQQALDRPNSFYLGPLINCTQDPPCCSDPLSDSCHLRGRMLQYHPGLAPMAPMLQRRELGLIKNTGERFLVSCSV